MNLFKWLVKRHYRGKIAGKNTTNHLFSAAKKALSQETADSGTTAISPSLSDNLDRMKVAFDRCSDFVIFPWQYGPDLKYNAFSIYTEALVQKKEHNYFKDSLQDLVTHEIGP